jgi:hypothetical protein
MSFSKVASGFEPGDEVQAAKEIKEVKELDPYVFPIVDSQISSSLTHGQMKRIAKSKVSNQAILIARLRYARQFHRGPSLDPKMLSALSQLELETMSEVQAQRAVRVVLFGGVALGTEVEPPSLGSWVTGLTSLRDKVHAGAVHVKGGQSVTRDGATVKRDIGFAQLHHCVDFVRLASSFYSPDIDPLVEAALANILELTNSPCAFTIATPPVHCSFGGAPLLITPICVDILRAKGVPVGAAAIASDLLKWCHIEKKRIPGPKEAYDLCFSFKVVDGKCVPDNSPGCESVTFSGSPAKGDVPTILSLVDESLRESVSRSMTVEEFDKALGFSITGDVAKLPILPPDPDKTEFPDLHLEVGIGEGLAKSFSVTRIFEPMLQWSFYQYWAVQLSLLTEAKMGPQARANIVLAAYLVCCPALASATLGTAHKPAGSANFQTSLLAWVDMASGGKADLSQILPWSAVWVTLAKGRRYADSHLWASGPTIREYSEKSEQKQAFERDRVKAHLAKRHLVSQSVDKGELSARMLPHVTGDRPSAHPEYITGILRHAHTLLNPVVCNPDYIGGHELECATARAAIWSSRANDKKIKLMLWAAYRLLDAHPGRRVIPTKGTTTARRGDLPSAMDYHQGWAVVETKARLALKVSTLLELNVETEEEAVALCSSFFERWQIPFYPVATSLLAELDKPKGSESPYEYLLDKLDAQVRWSNLLSTCVRTWYSGFSRAPMAYAMAEFVTNHFLDEVAKSDSQSLTLAAAVKSRLSGVSWTTEVPYDEFFRQMAKSTSSGPGLGITINAAGGFNYGTGLSKTTSIRGRSKRLVAGVAASYLAGDPKTDYLGTLTRPGNIGIRIDLAHKTRFMYVQPLDLLYVQMAVYRGLMAMQREPSVRSMYVNADPDGTVLKHVGIIEDSRLGLETSVDTFDYAFNSVVVPPATKLTHPILQDEKASTHLNLVLIMDMAAFDQTQRHSISVINRYIAKLVPNEKRNTFVRVYSRHCFETSFVDEKGVKRTRPPGSIYKAQGQDTFGIFVLGSTSGDTHTTPQNTNTNMGIIETAQRVLDGWFSNKAGRSLGTWCKYLKRASPTKGDMRVYDRFDAEILSIGKEYADLDVQGKVDSPRAFGDDSESRFIVSLDHTYSDSEVERVLRLLMKLLDFSVRLSGFQSKPGDQAIVDTANFLMMFVSGCGIARRRRLVDENEHYRDELLPHESGLAYVGQALAGEKLSSFYRRITARLLLEGGSLHAGEALAGAWGAFLEPTETGHFVSTVPSVVSPFPYHHAYRDSFATLELPVTVPLPFDAEAKFTRALVSSVTSIKVPGEEKPVLLSAAISKSEPYHLLPDRLYESERALKSLESADGAIKAMAEGVRYAGALERSVHKEVAETLSGGRSAFLFRNQLDSAPPVVRKNVFHSLSAGVTLNPKTKMVFSTDRIIGTLSISNGVTSLETSGVPMRIVDKGKVTNVYGKTFRKAFNAPWNISSSTALVALQVVLGTGTKPSENLDGPGVGSFSPDPITESSLQALVRKAGAVYGPTLLRVAGMTSEQAARFIAKMNMTSPLMKPVAASKWSNDWVSELSLSPTLFYSFIHDLYASLCVSSLREPEVVNATFAAARASFYAANVTALTLAFQGRIPGTECGHLRSILKDGVVLPVRGFDIVIS